MHFQAYSPTETPTGIKSDSLAWPFRTQHCRSGWSFRSLILEISTLRWLNQCLSSSLGAFLQHSYWKVHLTAMTCYDGRLVYLYMFYLNYLRELYKVTVDSSSFWIVKLKNIITVVGLRSTGALISVSKNKQSPGKKIAKNLFIPSPILMLNIF